jgi:hypothetical protein
MQLTAKHAARGFSTQGILWENRRASKTKLIIFLEFLFKISKRVAKALMHYLP